MQRTTHTILHFFIGILVATMTSCGVSRTVPISGRTQNIMVSDEEILKLSSEQYSSYMASATKSTNAEKTQMVQSVGKKLATAVQGYFVANGMESELKQYDWEFNLVQDKSINAFCMPGGKIVVYEGLLPVCQDEASLAIVLGHEIAHAVAKHSAEQISTKIRQQYGTQILGDVLVLAGMKENTAGLAQVVAQQGFNFSNLSYSRKHENEADRLGLVFAAMAGYDPRVAVGFWERMASATGNSGNFDAFSDHPADSKRIKNIQNCMPEALQYYKGGN